MPRFQDYQTQFTQYLRDPQPHHLPDKVSKKRMQVYANIVFNNLTASISACYPVLSECLGERKWRALTREFMRTYASASPIFRDIPEQFLHFLQTLDTGFRLGRWRYPPFVQALAHYEWVELALSSRMHQDLDYPTPTDWLQQVPVVNPVLENLVYAYPVHTLGAGQAAPLAQETYLIVYRTPQFDIRFMETNAVTHRLMTLLQTEPQTGESAFTTLAAELGYADVGALMGFGVGLLQSLYEQDVILGVRPPRILCSKG